MKSTEHDRIVERLAVEGLDALVRDATLREVVRGDAELRALVRALAEVDVRLSALTTPPAPEDLVARAIALGREVTPDPVIGSLPAPVANASTPVGTGQWQRIFGAVVAFVDRMPVGVRVVGGSLAVGAIAFVVAVPSLFVTRGADSASADDMPVFVAEDRLAAIVIEEEMVRQEYPAESGDDEGERAYGGDGWAEDAQAEASARIAIGREINDEMNGLGTLGTGSSGGGRPDGATDPGGRAFDGQLAGLDDGEGFGRGPGVVNRPASGPRSTSATTVRRPAAALSSPPPPPADPAPGNGYVDQTVRERHIVAVADDDERIAFEADNSRDGRYRQGLTGELAQDLDRAQNLATLTTRSDPDQGAVTAPVASYFLVPEEPEEATEEEAAPANAFDNQRIEQGGERQAALASSPDRALAASWLAERERIDGVATRPATGYWRNTYVPGDPLVRGLQQQVREAGGDAATLLDGARRLNQPWDPPTNSAMAVYVHADRSAVDGRRRMLVEVGLQGTERQTGRRPAMNVGVVLDLRSADAADGDAACALLESLAAARDIGDRFSVVVAGREGELLVPADAFGWGAVRVACDQLFGDDADLNRGGLDLATAWDRAFDTVLSADDPTAALGSSFVWVVTPGLSSMDVSLLERRAHTASVDGVPTSVVGLGSGADTALLDRVALAGQGHRRLVGSTEEAESVVNAEISAISRVVARAVRLRIRLAPGVELVDVIGSERLDDARAEQVRQVEQAIDQRLSRNLGIEADRGEDEDGIQIVIPAFMADDHHVILLDVIVDGPGAVVDVTARYKDLVHLRNGVSRGHLSVSRGDVEPGPLALNVTRNLVAWDVAQALTLAAAQLDAGSRTAATDELRRASSLVRGLRATVPGFASDASLDADLDLLADAIATTGRAPHGDPSVARALRAAGWLKLFSGPEAGDER